MRIRKMGLRERMLAAMTLVILIFTGSALLAANLLIQKSIQNTIEREMGRTQALFSQYLTHNGQSLQSQTRLVAELPIIQAVVSAADRPTILDTARTYLTTMKVGVIWVTDGHGILLARTDRPAEHGALLLESYIGQALKGDTALDIAVLDDKLYQIVAVPVVTAGRISGVFVAGSQLDDAVAADLKASTDTEVTFFVGDRLVASSFDSGARTSLAAAAQKGAWDRSGALGRGNPAGASETAVVAVGEESFFSRAIPLIRRDAKRGEAWYLIQRSVAEELGPSRRVGGALAIIGVLAILLSGVIGLLVARTIADPIGAVARAAQVLQQGQWPEPLPAQRDDEVGRLSQTFNRMVTSLQAGDEERRHAEHVLREAEERYRSVVEQASEGIFLVDMNTKRILEANAAYRNLLGYTPEEITRLTLYDVVAHNPESVDRAADETRKKVSHYIGERRHRRKDGSLVDVEVSASWLTYGGREILSVVARDNTERKKLEEQLRQAQKMEAIGVLAGGVAHDFNNLLNVISGYTELARDALPADHPSRPGLDNVSTAAFRAAELTHKLLAFSRRQVLRVDLLNFNDLLDEFSRMLTRIVGEDIEVKITKAPELLLVQADAGQIEQVLLNLCTNARQAMPGGGKITIETRRASIDGDFVTAHPWARAGEFLEFTLTDTGIGMDPTTLSRIFEPFFTTKETGTGLGLSMVYGIVQQHNGFLSVYSVPDQGTTFRVFLPLQEGEATRRAPAPRVALRGGTETILLAEDESLLRDLVATTLSDLGYRVIPTANGEEALQAFGVHQNEVALLVSDIVMPKMGAREAFTAMNAVKPGLRAIFITGYAPVAGPLAGLIEQKGVTLLQKPFSPSALAAKIRELLDAK